MTAQVSELKARLRAGLEGVTPGKWVVETEAEPEGEQPEVYVCSPQTACDYTVVATMGRAVSIPLEVKRADAAHIINTQPENIALLLDAFDEKCREVEEAKAKREAEDTATAEFLELVNTSVEQGARAQKLLIDEIKAKHGETIRRANEQAAEIERLREALKPFSSIAEIFDHQAGNRPVADTVMSWSDHRVGDRELTVEMLRAARSALLAKDPPK